MIATISGRPVLARRRRIPGPPVDAVKARLLRLFRALERRLGEEHWGHRNDPWGPGRTPFEVAVGAILTQHTAWINAAGAIAALREARLLDPRAVDAVPEAQLAAVIRAAGTSRVKARHLKAFTRWLLDRFDGRFGRMRQAPLRAVRTELLGVRGLGSETVDSILLHAAGRPVFVADAYARRVLARHRIVSVTGYEEARGFLERHLPSDPALFNEFHALLVAVGKNHCRAVPRCEDCPLRFDLRGLPPAVESSRARTRVTRARRTGPGVAAGPREPRHPRPV
jgi:endonuclease III related protein